MSVKFASFHELKKYNKNGETIKDVEASKYTTFHTGGKIKYLLKVSTLEGFIKVMMCIEKYHMPYFIMGNGSNVLVSDRGYNGVVLQLTGDLARIDMQGAILECGAGLRLAQVYTYARDLGLSGLEEGAGIPATIGGATYMNAQAYGFEMAKIVDYVVAYVDGKIRYFTSSDCGYSYRHSVFMENNAVILRVGLRLAMADRDHIQSVYMDTIANRRKTQPLEYPSAGCVFRRLDGYVVSKMLDEMGVKGMSVGGAMVSTKHANFIVNYDNATSTDVYELIKKIKKQFLAKYGLELHEEIEYLGEFE